MTGVVRLPKIPKITSLQYLTNGMLDDLDFRYIYGPPKHESNPLHKYQSKTIANDNFYLKKKEGRGQGSIMMFSCSELL